MNDLTKQISDLIDALPEAVKMVVYDGPLDNELSDLANKYQISDEDLEKVKGEVLLVIISLNKPETLEQTLSQQTSIDKQKIKQVCDEIMQKIILPLAAENVSETHPQKEEILHDIENPVPAKPILVNPAGVNPILDGQNNLPVGERKIETINKPVGNNISSSAVPSRGPLIGNYKSNFNSMPMQKPTITTPITPSATGPRPQTPIPPTPPAAPAPKSYTTDPYREPAV